MTRLSLAILLMSCGASSKVVVDAAGAQARRGANAEVRGRADNAKLSAVLVLSDSTPVYCLEISSWPESTRGHSVTATGTLESTDEFVAGPGEAGTSGPVWVLRGCKVSSP